MATNTPGSVILSVPVDHIDISSFTKNIDVVATATANKILKLDANAKLPTDITGNAATANTSTLANTLLINMDSVMASKKIYLAGSDTIISTGSAVSAAALATVDMYNGNIETTGTISGSKIYNAVWNDYAEYFPKDESTETEVGDIIALDMSNDKEVYTKADAVTNKMIVGIHSNSFGHIIGGKTPPEGESFESYNNDRFIPVGLIGRCYCKVKGPIKKGERIYVSDTPGVGIGFESRTYRAQSVGFAVESDDIQDENIIRLIKIFVSLY